MTAETLPAAALWQRLRRVTPARIGLGRAGDGLPTAPLLDFWAAHALARDAVHAPFNRQGIAGAVAALTGAPVFAVASAAADRATYLQRPDLGRRLAAADLAALPAGAAGSFDIAFVLADGLSATAVQAHGMGVLAATLAALSVQRPDWRIAPVTVAAQARVALGDEIGARLGALQVAVLIGERPGLTAADSLGIYLTYDPRPGRQDSERNCISNIHPPGGLDYATAAATLVGLMCGAVACGATGVHLKAEAPVPVPASAPVLPPMAGG